MIIIDFIEWDDEPWIKKWYQWIKKEKRAALYLARIWHNTWLFGQFWVAYFSEAMSKGHQDVWAIINITTILRTNHFSKCRFKIEPTSNCIYSLYPHSGFWWKHFLIWIWLNNFVIELYSTGTLMELRIEIEKSYWWCYIKLYLCAVSSWLFLVKAFFDLNLIKQFCNNRTAFYKAFNGLGIE